MSTAHPPATGTCRWLEKFNGRRGILLICSSTKKGTVTAQYEVVRWDGGYRLFKSGTDEVYDLQKDFSGCNCPDSLIRRRECKHTRAVRAAIERAAK